ncbi:oxygen-independent coproporphyrinogen III oxidase [Cupriavidus sp. DB3]|uniref:oxygen-independent coproporphyrinogen III oxidase n=1 Tax=Cupriavidus sp. DB3 TaxID=2873259 RepID=UPI001CF4DF30|nr:oxygen-independent coproporphyrinogen III oxidase [Cupriavidus sp. DB3]MCA7084719.1 oxygen-independent coproporphyrinogen III oxidase [Cupriavidus sp. DB3]
MATTVPHFASEVASEAVPEVPAEAASPAAQHAAIRRGDLADFRALAERIDVNGPRYTSYPTADRFDAGFGDEAYLSALDDCRAGGAAAPLSLYLHIPFCENICYYCGCNKIITRDHGRSARYVRYLAREMALVAARLGECRPVVQSHWGGGTPTFLDPAEMRQVMAALHRHFDLRPDGEHSIEIDPRRVDDERMALLAELGFNRVSLGVQDFDPEVQAAIHRVQPVQDTRRVVAASRRLGFLSISMDLIYGLPHQTAARFGATIERVLEMRPDRLSLYSYAHLPHVFKPQRRIDEATMPSAGEKLDILVSAIERLTAAGYVHIGMDHFALPDDALARAQREGRLQRNFQGYATHASHDQLGFGISAIGAVAGRYVQNARTLDAYYGALDAGRLPVLRGHVCDADDRVRKDIIGALMCDGELDTAEVARRHGIDFDAEFAAERAELASLAAQGLVRLSDARIEVTPLGRLLVRRVAMVFDRYLRDDRVVARQPGSDCLSNPLSGSNTDPVSERAMAPPLQRMPSTSRPGAAPTARYSRVV